MEKKIYSNYWKLANDMMEIADDDGTAYAICFFDDAVKLLKELTSLDETSIGGIEIADEDYNGYSKEYYISVDSDYIIDVQPAWHESNKYSEAGYYGFEAEKVYIVGEANSIIIKDVDKSKCCEIDFCDTNIEIDDLFDLFLDNAKLVTDREGNAISIGVDISKLLHCLIYGE